MEIVTNSSAPKPSNIPKPKNCKTLNLKSDKNNDFEIQFYVYENNLIFEGNTKNAIPQKNYKKIYSLENVQTNKYFLICETINEIYDEILNQISQNETGVKINEKMNNIILTIPLNTKKIKECSFEIDEVANNTNGQISELYTIVNQLTNEVKTLKEKNKELEGRLEEMEKIFLLPYKEKLEKEQKRQLEEKQRKEDLNKIRKWVYHGKDESVGFNLLYKKSRDGSSTKDFHKHCDNKGETLILIETTEGRKFGGVAYDSWDTNGNWRKNANDFVFSLDLDKKYNYSGKGSTTLGDLNSGFTFGNNKVDEIDIGFKNESLEEGISKSSQSFKTNNELNNGKTNFKTKEIEVYSIKYGKPFKPIRVKNKK